LEWELVLDLDLVVEVKDLVLEVKQGEAWEKVCEVLNLAQQV
jgi:hypothetical protein